MPLAEIDFVAGDATAQVKDLALTYLELTALSYPAAAIALIGSGVARSRHQNPAADQRRDEYPQYLNQQRACTYGIFSWPGWVCRRRAWADHCSLYWRDSHDLGADGGPQLALRLSLKGYFKPFNFAIIWEVMIGIPASNESVLFNGGKLLTQMFVAGWAPTLSPATLSPFRWPR